MGTRIPDLRSLIALLLTTLETKPVKWFQFASLMHQVNSCASNERLRNELFQSAVEVNQESVASFMLYHDATFLRFICTGSGIVLNLWRNSVDGTALHVLVRSGLV